MSYLMDTNVLSELMRAHPRSSVVEWASEVPFYDLYVSAVTIGEIRFGIERMTTSQRKRDLTEYLEQNVIDRFGQNILPVDYEVADIFGRLQAQLHRQGNILPILDLLIAATALTNNLIVVTRNIADFEPTGTRMLNPWQGLIS